MSLHQLKTWPEHFRDVKAGKKKAEIRKDDRGFKVGDVCWLDEWYPEDQTFTGDRVVVLITHVLPLYEVPGQEARYHFQMGRYVMFSFEILPENHIETTVNKQKVIDI